VHAGTVTWLKTYLKIIEFRPLPCTNNGLSPLRTTLWCHTDVSDDVVEPSKHTLLPPDLCDCRQIMSMVSYLQLLQGRLGLLSKQEGLSSEIDDMSKAPEASSEALLRIHSWIKLTKNDVDADIIRRGVIQNKEANATSNPVFLEDFEEQSSHVFPAMFTFETAESDEIDLTGAISVNIVGDDCHESVAVGRGPEVERDVDV
jgi:hypothetical protein